MGKGSGVFYGSSLPARLSLMSWDVYKKGVKTKTGQARDRENQVLLKPSQLASKLLVEGEGGQLVRPTRLAAAAAAVDADTASAEAAAGFTAIKFCKNSS